MMYQLNLILIFLTCCFFASCSFNNSNSDNNREKRSIDFEIHDDINTHDLHNNKDFDLDGIIDFDEAFGFVTECPPPSYLCEVASVAVRLSPKQWSDFCSTKVSEDQAKSILKLLCKEQLSDIVELNSNNAAFVRIGSIFKQDGFNDVVKASEADSLIRKLKQYPKDTRKLYSILDPFGSVVVDSDGDSLPDLTELQMGYSDEVSNNRYGFVNSPGNRPSVAAVPVIRIVTNEVLVTPEIDINEVSSTSETLQQSNTVSAGGSMSFESSIQVGAGFFGPISQATYSLAYSQNWGVATDELNATTLTDLYSTSFNQANYAAVTPSGFLANIGSAPVVRSTLQAPATIAGTPLGSLAFKYFWEGNNATTSPMQDQTFVRENVFYMTRNQYRQFFIGAPIEFDLNLIEGDIYEDKDYSLIQNRVVLQTASIIWEGNYNQARTGRDYKLPYQQYIYAGGNRPSTIISDSNVPKPIVPVTLKDALVAILGYHEIWVDDPETGVSYLERVVFREGPEEWNDASGGVDIERISFISNFSNASNGSGRRNPWLMKDQGRARYFAKDKNKQESYDDYERMLSQIIRPQDQFLLSLANLDKEAEIVKAAIVKREGGGAVASILVEATRVQEVRLKMELAGKVDYVVLQADNQNTGIKLYEHEFNEGEELNNIKFTAEVLIDGRVVDDKVVQSIISKDKKPQPNQLPAIVGSAQGQYSHHQVPGFNQGYPILKSFHFTYARESEDRPFHGISVIPSAYSMFNRFSGDQSQIDRYLSSSVYDWNGDDSFEYNIEYVSLDDSLDIEIKSVEGKSCQMGINSVCRLEVEVDQNEVFALVGFEFELENNKEITLKGIEISPVTVDGKSYVDARLYSSKEKFNVNIAYVALPENLFVTTGNSPELPSVSGTGIESASNSQVLDAPGLKILRGFKFEFTGNSSGHIRQLGFEFDQEKPIIEASLTDDTNEREFYYSFDYAFLKKEL